MVFPVSATFAVCYGKFKAGAEPTGYVLKVRQILAPRAAIADLIAAQLAVQATQG